MSALALITALLWLVLIVLWLSYCVEAFRDSPGQGLLTALLPAYVLYYACIRSRRAPVTASLLAVVALLVLALSRY